jgi:hypothetical protein
MSSILALAAKFFALSVRFFRIIYDRSIKIWLEEKTVYLNA